MYSFDRFVTLQIEHLSRPVDVAYVYFWLVVNRFKFNLYRIMNSVVMKQLTVVTLSWLLTARSVPK